MRYLLALALLIVAPIVFAANTAQLTFTAPTAYTDGSPIPAGTALRYHVFQRKTGEADFAEVAVVTASPTAITTGLGTGEYCWQVTAEVDGVQSTPSNAACKSFAAPIPSTVVITVQ